MKELRATSGIVRLETIIPINSGANSRARIRSSTISFINQLLGCCAIAMLAGSSRCAVVDDDGSSISAGIRLGNTNQTATLPTGTSSHMMPMQWINDCYYPDVENG